MTVPLPPVTGPTAPAALRCGLRLGDGTRTRRNDELVSFLWRDAANRRAGAGAPGPVWLKG